MGKPGETIFRTHEAISRGPRRRPETHPQYHKRGINKGTDHDQDISKRWTDNCFHRFAVRSADSKLCIQSRGAADVHQRRVSPLQLGNSERRSHHGLHVAAADKPEHRLQDGDGKGSCTAIAKRSLLNREGEIRIAFNDQTKGFDHADIHPEPDLP